MFRRNVSSLTLLAVLLVPTYTHAEDAEPARLRYLEGSVTVKRATTAEAQAGIPNLPLEPGDRLWTGSGGRAEIFLPGGILVWVNNLTTLDFVTLESDVRKPHILRVWGGSLFVHSGVDSNLRGNVRVAAPAGSVAIVTAGTYRIDIDVEDERRLLLSTFDGVAELAAGMLTEQVDAGKQSYLESEMVPSRAVEFDSAQRDTFAAWQNKRLAAISGTQRYVRERKYVPLAVSHHAADLESYGNWRYYSGFKAWGWRPRAIDWSPYRHGRWVHTRYGWTWAPYEGWGWVTVHYGRWHYDNGFGWVWFPGQTYSPAWVSWYVAAGYVGWCPIGFFNRPILSLDFYLYRDRGHGYDDRHSSYGRHSNAQVVYGGGYRDGPDQAWTFVAANKLAHGDALGNIVDRKVIPLVGQSGANTQLQSVLQFKDSFTVLSRGMEPEATSPSDVMVRDGGHVNRVKGHPTDARDGLHQHLGSDGVKRLGSSATSDLRVKSLLGSHARRVVNGPKKPGGVNRPAGTHSTYKNGSFSVPSLRGIKPSVFSGGSDRQPPTTSTLRPPTIRTRQRALRSSVSHPPSAGGSARASSSERVRSSARVRGSKKLRKPKGN